MMQKIKKFIKMWRNATWADLRPVKPMYKSKSKIAYTFKLNPEQIKQNEEGLKIGFLNWNTLSLDQMVEYLEEKHKFSSTGESKCIFELIEFYKKHKDGTT
jgi:outer membrane biogenesis lipoprotein LolB